MTADRADVAIIGAGVIGCSVAFHLARLGRPGVCLIEKEPLPGAGSTSKANGGIRAQFTTEINVAMSLASMAILDALADEIGEPPLYRKAGYLFLTGDPARLSAMTAAAAFQRARGVSVEVLDAAGVRAKAPYAAGPILGGTFGPRDGFIDPGGLTNFFLREATRAGVKTRYGAEVTAVERDSSGEFCLRTAAGEIRASAVVDAAGPFSGRVAALVGVDLPVVPVRRHILISGPCPSLPQTIPMTIDADSGVLIRREGEPGPDRVLQPRRAPRLQHRLRPGLPAPHRRAAGRAFSRGRRSGPRHQAELGRALRGDARPPRRNRPHSLRARLFRRLRFLRPRHHARAGGGPGGRRDDRPGTERKRGRRRAVPRTVRPRRGDPRDDGPLREGETGLATAPPMFTSALPPGRGRKGSASK